MVSFHSSDAGTQRKSKNHFFVSRSFRFLEKDEQERVPARTSLTQENKDLSVVSWLIRNSFKREVVKLVADFFIFFNAYL